MSYSHETEVHESLYGTISVVVLRTMLTFQLEGNLRTMLTFLVTFSSLNGGESLIL